MVRPTPTVLVLAALLPLLPASGTTALAQAAETAGIGIAAPLSGSTEILGRQLVNGAEAAIERLGEGEAAIETIQADSQCTAQGGAAAAETFVEADVAVVVGFLCSDALEAALPILAEADIPTINVGVRSSRFTEDRDRTGHLIWRIAPGPDDQADAIAAAIAKRWRTVPFGIVDDGTIDSRGLADAVRMRLEAEGLKPLAVDNYRPAEEKQFGLARRIERTGVTRLFIAGDRPDIAIIARDAASIGLDLDIIGGEALFDEESVDTPLQEGIVSVAPMTRFPELDDEPDAPSETDEEPSVPSGYFGPAFVAAEIAAAAIAESADSGRSLVEILDETRFSTSLGPVSFGPDGGSNLDLYRVFRWQGDRFVTEAGG